MQALEKLPPAGVKPAESLAPTAIHELPERMVGLLVNSAGASSSRHFIAQAESWRSANSAWSDILSVLLARSRLQQIPF